MAAAPYFPSGLRTGDTLSIRLDLENRELVFYVTEQEMLDLDSYPDSFSKTPVRCFLLFLQIKSVDLSRLVAMCSVPYMT